MTYQNKKNRILLITPYNENSLYKSRGGIGRWSILFVQYLRDNDIEFDIVDTTPIGKRLEKNNSKKNIFVEIFRAWRIISSTKIKIRKFRPSIVHLNSSLSVLGVFRDYLCLKIARKKEIRTVLHLHCNVEMAYSQSILVKKLFKRMTSLANMILALNKDSADFCKTINKDAKVIKMPNFISNDQVVASKKNINDAINTAVYIGFIQKEKGINEIIDLAMEFNNIKFLLVGNVSDYYQIKTYPSNIEIIQNATREQVFEILDSSDVFIFLSYSEGFSMALLEAMSRGLPVLCSNVGANEEMIESKGGFIVNPQDSLAAKHFLRELDNKIIRRNFSKFNIKKVTSEYTLDIIGERILQVYKEL